MTARGRRFPLVDSLRALAALSVLAFHACTTSTVLAALRAKSLIPYAAHLDVGVNVFFVITGFLLYRPFARARLEGDDHLAVGAYAWRRFLRIVPAYWVALTLIALWLSLPGVFETHGLRLYGFAQIYSADSIRDGLPQAWTLCVEVTFYAFVPLFALVMRGLRASTPRGWLRSELVVLALLAASSVAYKVWAVGRVDTHPSDAGTLLSVLPNFLDQFALGMALAVGSIAAEAGLLRFRRDAAVVRWQSASWVLALVAFYLAGRFTSGPGKGGAAADPDDLLLRHGLHALFAVAIVLPAVLPRHDRSLAQRVLALRPLLWIGLISYSLYLWHGAVILKLEDWLGQPSAAPRGLGLLALTAVGSIAVAAASYYAVERPALKLKSAFRDRRATPDQPGAASAPTSPPRV